MKKRNRADRRQLNKGQAAILASILFLLISLTILGALGYISATQLKSSRDLMSSKRAYMNAESALEDVVLRLKLQKSVDSLETLAFSDGSTVQTAYTFAGGEYAVESKADVLQHHRNVKMRIKLGWELGLPFSGAVEAGFLGTKVNGSAIIQGVSGTQGNVISAGTIDGSAGTADMITGDVKVAKPIANDPSYGQRNPSSLSYPSPPSYPAPWDPNNAAYNRKIRDVVAHESIAQSFIPSVTAYAVRARIYMKKSSASVTSGIDAYIINNDATVNTAGGQPYPVGGGQRLGHAALSSSDPQLKTTFDWVTFEFNLDRPAVENQKYWLILRTSGTSATEHYVIAVATDDAGYVYGQNGCYATETWCNSAPDGDGAFGPATAKYSANAGAASPTWTTSGLGVDLVFQVDMGEGSKYGTEFTTKVQGTDVGGTIIAGTVDDVRTTTETGSITYKNVVGGAIGNSWAAYGTASTERCDDGDNTALCIDTGATEPGPSPRHQFTNFGGGQWQESIDYWKTQATAGGVVCNNGTGGDCNVSGTMTLGSGIIQGRLTLGSGSTLVLQGGSYLWVQGASQSNMQGSGGNKCNIRVNDFDLNGKRMPAHILFNSKISVQNCILGAYRTEIGDDPANPGFIHMVSIYDGRLVSGEPQSTAKIDVGTKGGTFFVPLGEVLLKNNSDVVAIRAAKIQVQDNTVVTYEQGAGVPEEGTGGDITLEFFEFRETE